MSHIFQLFTQASHGVARTREEFEQAYALVYQEYLKRGYVNEASSQLRLSFYNALPETTTFAVTSNGHIAATATVIPDSPLGLPIDELYGEELAFFRKQNKKICEVSMLASNTELFREGTSMMLNAKKMFFIFFLFKHIFNYVRNHLHLDYIFITINPKHQLTYESLHFVDVGPLRFYDKVNGAPALGKYVEVGSVAEKILTSNKSGMYKMIFKGQVSPEVYARRVCFSLEDIKYFFIEKSNVLLKASPEQMNYIKQCYPSYNFSEIIPANTLIY